MNKNSKMLLIFPPQWTPISPHFALASLMGQLKNKGYSATCLDLNIEFYNKILKSNYVKNALKELIHLMEKTYGAGVLSRSEKTASSIMKRL